MILMLILVFQCLIFAAIVCTAVEIKKLMLFIDRWECEVDWYPRNWKDGSPK